MVFYNCNVGLFAAAFI